MSGLEADEASAGIKKRVIREAFRAILKTIKKVEIEKFKLDEENYKLNPKA